MAGKGTFTALQALRPITTDFGAIAKGEEDNAFKYREEKRAKEEKAQKESEATALNPIEDIWTGIDNLDDALFKGTNDVGDANFEDYKRARKDPAYAKSSEYIIKSQNRKNYSKNLRALTDSYTEFSKKVVAMGGDMSGWNSDTMSEVNGFFKEERVRFGENKYGEPIAFIADIDTETGKTKKNEDGSPKYTETSLGKVLKGTGMYDLVPKVDIIASVKDIGDVLGESLKDVKQGRKITSEQTWENRRAGAKTLVESGLGSVRNPTALAKRMWSDEMEMDKKDWNEAAYAQVTDKLLEKVRATYDEKLKIAYDYSGDNADAARKAKADEDVVTPRVTPDSNTGIPVVTKIPGLGGNKQGYSVSFGKGVLTSKTEGSSELVDNVWVAEDGKMYATKKKATKVSKDAVSVLDETGEIDKNKMLDVVLGGGGGASGWKVEEVTEELSETDFTNLAKNPSVKKQGGGFYKDGKELKDEFRDQHNTMPKKSASAFNKKEKTTTGAGKFNPNN
jgi:hypothetical protein